MPSLSARPPRPLTALRRFQGARDIDRTVRHLPGHRPGDFAFRLRGVMLDSTIRLPAGARFRNLHHCHFEVDSGDTTTPPEPAAGTWHGGSAAAREALKHRRGHAGTSDRGSAIAGARQA